jgi:drug/metabolite transporter (DMT)-like permease
MATNRIMTTSRGTNVGAFTIADWSLFSALGLIWGSSFLLMAIGLDSFRPGLVTLLRLVSASVFFASLPAVRRTRIDREDWPRLSALAFTWAALPFTLFPIAQQWIDSGVAGMLNGTTPIFAAIITAMLLRSLPGRLQMLGVIFGFLGVVLITMPTADNGGSALLGIFLGLVASASYGLSITISVPLLQRYGTLPVMGRMMWVGTIIVAPYGLLTLGDSTFTWSALAATLAVGLVGTGLAFILAGKLAGRVGSTRGAFVAYVIPVVALALGALVRQEQVAPLALAGVVMVLFGAFLASRREA